MPYVERDASNKVKGCYACQQPGIADELLAVDHPDVLAYLNPPPPTPEELEARCRREFDQDRVFRAKCISDLAFRLGKAPGALTAVEVQSERDRIAAIYKAL